MRLYAFTAGVFAEQREAFPRESTDKTLKIVFLEFQHLDCFSFPLRMDSRNEPSDNSES